MIHRGDSRDQLPLTPELLRHTTHHPYMSDPDDSSAKAPGRTELEALINTYAPIVYFHPDEIFNIASVEWYLQHARLVNHSTFDRLEVTADLLPQSKEGRDSFHLEVKDPAAFPGEECMRLAKTYVHAKACETHTDLQFWFFFPRNGSATASMKWLIDNIVGHSAHPDLEPLGKQEGRWKRISLRIDNRTRELTEIYLSQPGGGAWLPADNFQKQGKQVIVFVSKHTHHFYHAAGTHHSEALRVGVYSSALELCFRNETGKGGFVNCANCWELISAEHLGDNKPEWPLWLNFPYSWGKEDMSYLNQKTLKEIITRAFGAKLSFLLSNAVMMEVLAYLQTYFTLELQNGSDGPRYKECWHNDEC